LQRLSLLFKYKKNIRNVMGVKEFLAKAFKKDERFKELEKEMRIRKMIEERMKPSNERELERYMEEERQKTIKKHLEEFRNARKEEAWHGESILNQKNIFKGHKSILNEDKSILENGRGILNDKKLFSMKKGATKKKGGLFFKR